MRDMATCRTFGSETVLDCKDYQKISPPEQQQRHWTEMGDLCDIARSHRAPMCAAPERSRIPKCAVLRQTADKRFGMFRPGTRFTSQDRKIRPPTDSTDETVCEML